MSPTRSVTSETDALRGRTEPRIFTRPLRELTPETSLGFEVIDFARDVLEVELYPWQEWLLIHALELNPDGTFRFRKVFVLVGRQNGKSTLLQILTLWRMYLDKAALVLGTAQDRGLARDQFLGAVSLAQDVEYLAEEIEDFTPSRGFEKFVLTEGQSYVIAASNRRAGRGKSVDLLLMDELREHQTWEAWSAVSKTTNARERGQTWAVSNAGDVTSVVLRHFRARGHLAEGDPDGINKGLVSPTPDDVDDEDETLAIFEWSADPTASVWDRDGWAQANPSMNYGPLTDRIIRSDATNDPEHVFRTEVLCQWVSSVERGPFPANAWQATTLLTVTRDKTRPAAYCVDMSHNRTWVSICLAFWDTEGRRRVELAARAPGPDWVIPWLTSPDRLVKPDMVTLQTNGAPVSALADAFEKADIHLTPWAGKDLSAASGMFFDAIQSAIAVEDREAPPTLVLTHGVQPPLDLAANTAAVKALGDGAWTVDRRNSPEDAAPLMAAFGAHWLLMTGEPKFRSAYEDSDLEFA